MSETKLNQSARAQQGAFSVLLRACSAITFPQCTNRFAHLMVILVAFFIATACSDSNKNSTGSGGSPFGGEASQSGIGNSGNGGTSSSENSAPPSGGGSIAAGGTSSCSLLGSTCQAVNDCCYTGRQLYCVSNACTDMWPPTTGGSSSTGGAQSTGGNVATGGVASVCGNGIIERGETCDPPSSCPTTCPGQNACYAAKTTGSAATCDLFCDGLTPVTTCKSGDLCCPYSCNYTNDTDCPNTGGASCSRDSAIDVTNTSGGCNFVSSGTYLWGWSCSGADPNTQGLSCVYGDSTASSTLYCCTSK